jgi:hypothetical protein
VYVCVCVCVCVCVYLCVCVCVCVCVPSVVRRATAGCHEWGPRYPECYRGVTVALQEHYSGVIMVL